MPIRLKQCIFLIQADELSRYVLAEDFINAIALWKKAMRREYPEDTEEPVLKGVQLIANSYELIWR